jgi:UDP-N-acetylmuramoyl-tripeptide--D-alanyl-D-alanine ligase
VLVIDDSYNGNPDGAHAAIDVLEKFISRRTIYVTPGLVEMGDRSEEVHHDIGKHLGAVVDVVVLIETSVTDWIVEGLRQAGFAGELITFESPQKMHPEISDLLKTGDVLLFQNDWPENYR